MRALLRRPHSAPTAPTTVPSTASISKHTAQSESGESSKTGKRKFSQTVETLAPVTGGQRKDDDARVALGTSADTVHTSVSSASSITSVNSHPPHASGSIASEGSSTHRLTAVTPSVTTNLHPTMEPSPVVLSGETPPHTPSVRAPCTPPVTPLLVSATVTPPVALSVPKLPVEVHITPPVPLLPSADAAPKALECISWLGTALSARGTSPHWVRECEACLVVREGFCTKESFAAAPVDRMTHAYLSEIGIAGLGMQQIILQLHKDMKA